MKVKLFNHVKLILKILGHIPGDLMMNFKLNNFNINMSN